MRVPSPTPPGAPLPEGCGVASREAVLDALRTVYDPEIPVNIYDLGLIYRLDIGKDGNVSIDMTLTAPACPVAGAMPRTVAEAVAAVAGGWRSGGRTGLGTLVVARPHDRRRQAGPGPVVAMQAALLWDARMISEAEVLRVFPTFVWKAQLKPEIHRGSPTDEA